MAADLVALGPTRDHAWVVDWRPLRCLLGPLGRPLGGFSEACLLAVWGLLEVFWGPLGLLGASLGSLGASWGPPDGLGGHLGEKGASPRLGPSWSHLEVSEGHRKRKGEKATYLKFLRFWEDLGFSEASLGGPVATWDRLGAVLGLLGVCWKPS